MLLIGLFLLIPCICNSNYVLEQEFSSYVKRFGKIYVDASERNYRMKLFHENLKIIETHNKRQSSYTLGHTPFTDLSNEEFSARFTNNQVLQKKSSTIPMHFQNAAIENEFSLPSNIDWRNKNAVTSVKNQLHCGSCWAFSAVGAIEGAYAISEGILESLSPQNLVDCDTGDNGCSGGLMTNAYEYIMQQGVSTEDEYPYRGNEGNCKKTQNVKKILGYYDVPVGSAFELQKAIVKNPVSVAIEADSAVFQNYVSGVIDDNSCGTTLNHGVLVVGYDQDNRIPYYVVKNSWGSEWGEQGYVRLAINQSYAGMCGIHLMASYPFLDV